MRTVSQLRVGTSEDPSTPHSELQNSHSLPGRNSPQIDRQFVAGATLDGGVPGLLHVPDLLAAPGGALEPADAIARTSDGSPRVLGKARFEKALETLDAGVEAYLGDPALVTRCSNLQQQDQSSRLKPVEPAPPPPEKNRSVQRVLERIATLEQLQQWQWALSILEQALQSYPASQELIAAAQRVRQRLEEREREKKLARRIKLIERRIASHSWKPALALLEYTQKEFPAALELDPLRRDVNAGLQRTERDALAAEVRQCMADGELELADQTLTQGMESLGPEPALQALRKELDDETNYREAIGKARTLFARRELQEAENVLEGLAAQNRGEVQELLDAVRRARTFADEADFCERGRQMARKLLRENQIAQAVDLLSNLQSLFPGNPVLERDWISAQAALGNQPPQPAPAPTKKADGQEKSGVELPPAPPPAPLRTVSLVELNRRERAAVRVTASSRVRRATLAGTASVMLVSAGGTAWKLSRTGAPVSAAPVKQVAPSGQLSNEQEDRLPGTMPVVSANLQLSVADPAIPVGALIRQAQPVERVAPVYPAVARQRGLSGVVQMQATINEQGAVKDVKVVSGDAVLAAAAANALLKWKWKPAVAAGRPVASRLSVQFSFQDRNK